MVFQWSNDFLDLKYFIINHNSGLNIKKKSKRARIQAKKNTLGNKKKLFLKLVEEQSKRIKTTAVKMRRADLE